MGWSDFESAHCIFLRRCFGYKHLHLGGTRKRCSSHVLRKQKRIYRTISFSLENKAQLGVLFTGLLLYRDGQDFISTFFLFITRYMIGAVGTNGCFVGFTPSCMMSGFDPFGVGHLRCKADLFDLVGGGQGCILLAVFAFCVGLCADPIDPQMLCHIKGNFTLFYFGEYFFLMIYMSGWLVGGAFIFLLSTQGKGSYILLDIFLGGAKMEIGKG